MRTIPVMIASTVTPFFITADGRTIREMWVAMTASGATALIPATGVAAVVIMNILATSDVITQKNATTHATKRRIIATHPVARLVAMQRHTGAHPRGGVVGMYKALRLPHTAQGPLQPAAVRLNTAYGR